MPADRYLKIVLTVIAMELLWLGLKDAAPRVAAQDVATKVVITGIELEPTGEAFVPVALVGTYRQIPKAHAARLERTRVHVIDPIAVEAPRPLKIETERPLPVTAEEPLPVRAIREPGSQRPGH